MKIAVLCGSPKGELSITLQYVRFIQKKFPQHEFRIFHISEKIKEIEKNEKLFLDIIDEIRNSDGVLWAFPVYIFLVPSQYKRFIELIWEKKQQEVFNGKYTAVLTSSIHFYDHTAHNYMNAICDDLSMKYIGSFSADMYDLLIEKERKRLLLFFESSLEMINKKQPTSRRYGQLIPGNTDYVPSISSAKTDIGDKKIVLLTDSTDKDTNLVKMIWKFKDLIIGKVDTINLNDLDIKGGCLGCLHCTFDNTCIYEEKDEFTKFYNTKLKTADMIIFAGSIKDRYLSAGWKLFFDRAFFNTHIPVLIGKQMGFIISGPFSQIQNLCEILEAQIALYQSNLVDFVTDEYKNSSEIDALLQSFTRRLNDFSIKHYIKSSTFRNIAGMKIFRDYIWGRLRFLLQADHRYYKRHGMYDFPQKNIRARIFNEFVALITKIPVVKKEFVKNIKENMVKPHKRMLKKIK